MIKKNIACFSCLYVLFFFTSINGESTPKKSMQQEIDELVRRDMQGVSLFDEQSKVPVVVTFLKPLIPNSLHGNKPIASLNPRVKNR